MRYARCKCGESEAWTSGMPLNKCSWCDKCQSDLSYGKDGHATTRTIHRMVLPKDEKLLRLIEGAQKTEEALRGKPEHQSALSVIETLLRDNRRCKYCMDSQRTLIKNAEPMEFDG